MKLKDFVLKPLKKDETKVFKKITEGTASVLTDMFSSGMRECDIDLFKGTITYKDNGEVKNI